METARTRRVFLGEAAAAAATLTLPAPARATRAARRPTVAVFGGGIAGLTAAHELIERGFDVTVHERRAWGGKARSMSVPGTGAGGRRPLPGEHGYRIFFGFYQVNPDTFRRIPFGNNPNGVFDNLVGVPQIDLARAGKRDVILPVQPLEPQTFTPSLLEQTVLALALEQNIPPEAAALFARKMAVFLSSSNERRIGQWDNVSWDEFIQAAAYGGDYRDILSEPFTHLVQASRADDTSTAFVGFVLESVVYNLLERNSNGPMDRIFNAPTNEAFIDPWIAHLRSLGVKLRLGHAVTGLHTDGGRISGARVRTPRGRRTIEADHYVVALPVERARRLLTPAILDADPSLAGMFELKTGWMNGIQLYLRERPDIPAGHIACMNSPWLISGILQTQFWDRDFAGQYGDGTAKDCFSAIISDWNVPGVLHGRPAKDCTDAEIVEEIWEQLKRHLNDAGQAPLRDDMLLSWFVDPGLHRRDGVMHNDDPLVLPSVGAWKHRPESATAVENLFLAGDYPRGFAEVANMEAANHSGRLAANAVLQRAGSHETPAFTGARYVPPEWAALREQDAARYAAGQPNAFDT
jgi:uncharacterized protein with NAD-binding domain and iron-sulfur cluster